MSGSRKLVPLTRNLLLPDAPLLVPVYTLDGTLLAARGIELTSDQISKLNRDNPDLYTLQKYLELKSERAGIAERAKKAYHFGNPFDRITKIRDQLIEILSKPPEKASIGLVLQLARRLQMICEETPDIAIASIFIDLPEHYAVQHMLHVAVLVELSAKGLAWPENERISLVAASLTMNSAMGLLPDELASQETPLTPEQKAIILQHPAKSAELLESIGVNDRLWLDSVRYHHESIDGNGYPERLRADEIPEGASLLHVADVYCAKVAGRYYRDPIEAPLAAKQVFLSRDKVFKANASEVMVKLVGLYPPGNQVRLANGDTAVVVKRGERVDTPVVRSITNNKNERFAEPPLRNSSHPQYTVKEIVYPNVVKWDPKYPSIWGYTSKD